MTVITLYFSIVLFPIYSQFYLDQVRNALLSIVLLMETIVLQLKWFSSQELCTFPIVFVPRSEHFAIIHISCHIHTPIHTSIHTYSHGTHRPSWTCLTRFCFGLFCNFVYFTEWPYVNLFNHRYRLSILIGTCIAIIIGYYTKLILS